MDRPAEARAIPGSYPGGTHLPATILKAYQELPGLTLYVHQAARLFGVPSGACGAVLDDLVRQGHLGRTSDGQYAGRAQ